MQSFDEGQSAMKTLAKAFIVTLALAALMMLMAFGFEYLFNGSANLPVSIAILAVIFAVVFVAAVVLLQRSGTGTSSSLLGGAAVALAATIAITTVICGAIVALNNIASNTFFNDNLLIGLAISLVAGVVINMLTLKM